MSPNKIKIVVSSTESQIDSKGMF